MEGVAEVMEKMENPAAEEKAEKVEIKEEASKSESNMDEILDANMALEACGCEKFEMVEKISLKEKRIKEISCDFFEKLTNLKELDLDDNQLNIIPVSVGHESLKVLSCARNNLKSVNEFSFFKNLECLDISGNDKIQVSERYKLVSVLLKLKSLDGKDVDLMREAIGRLDAMLAGKLRELLRITDLKIYGNKDLTDEEYMSKLEAKVLPIAKKKISVGPEVLKGYREYKLESLLKLELPDYLSSQKDSHNGKEDIGLAEQQGKRIRERKVPTSSDGNIPEKRRKSEECQVDEIGDEDEENKYQLTYLLQTHSLNNDPKDWETKVWMCEFEPDPERPGQTTKICATCGGDSVCFIDSDTGLVMKKYKQPQEVFYCLAWTIVDQKDENSETVKKASMLAVAGLHGDIKLIDPQQLICYQEVSHHKKAIDALLFHPLHPTWLFSGSEDKTIILWDIAIPNSPSMAVKKLLTLKAGNIVRQIVVVPHGKVLVGSCDDGCYVWNIDKIEEHQTRSAVFKFIFPGDRRLPVDSVSCVSNSLVATKRIEEGQIQLWYSKSEFAQNDVTISHVLPWRVTDTPFLKFNFMQESNMLLAGDDEGFVWLYDLSKVHDQLPDPDDRERRAPLQLRHTKCLRCTNPLSKLFNHVAAGHQMRFIVAVSDTNVVAIWRKNPANPPTSRIEQVLDKLQSQMRQNAVS